MKLPTPKAYVAEQRNGHLTQLAEDARRLFPLKLIGAGTAEVEAVTSYASRLATEHGVGARQFGFMLPRLLKVDGMKRTHVEDLYTMNGTGMYASVWIDLLRGATLQRNLVLGSLFHFRNVLSPSKSSSVAKNRRWCPHCLIEMRETESGPYLHLIWQLVHAGYCPRHGIKLREVCPACGSAQLQVSGLVSIDRCAQCQSDLCENAQDVEHLTSKNANEVTWINKSLTELIMVGNTPLEIADNAFCRFIKTFVESFGSNATVEKLRGYSRDTVNQWARSRYRPSLSTLLDVCAKTNIPVSLILREPELAVATCQELDLGAPNTKFSFCKAKILRHLKKKRDRVVICQRAEALLAKLPRRRQYVSQYAFADKLDIPYGTLHYLAPHIMRKLNQRNKLVRNSAYKRAKTEAARQIRRACKEIQREGGRLSREVVVRRVQSKKGSIGRSKLLAAYSLYRAKYLSHSKRLRIETKRVARKKSPTRTLYGRRPVHLRPH